VGGNGAKVADKPPIKGSQPVEALDITHRRGLWLRLDRLNLLLVYLNTFRRNNIPLEGHFKGEK